MSIMNLSANGAKMRRIKPLTPKQRKLLGFTLARKAWERLGTDEAFEEWRHREAREATQMRDAQGQVIEEGVTISEACQMHFDALFDHFKMLAGEAELQVGPQAEQECRQILHSIATLQRELGLTDAYLGGIIKRVCHGARTWSTAAEGRAVLNALRYEQQRRKNKQQREEQGV